MQIFGQRLLIPTVTRW